MTGSWTINKLVENHRSDADRIIPYNPAGLVNLTKTPFVIRLLCFVCCCSAISRIYICFQTNAFSFPISYSHKEWWQITITQSINHSIDQSLSRSPSQSIKQPITQSINHSIDHPVNLDSDSDRRVGMTQGHFNPVSTMATTHRLCRRISLPVT